MSALATPGPMRPGPHLPPTVRSVRLGVVQLPIGDIDDRPTLHQHVVGVDWDPHNRTLTWTRRGIGIDLGDRDGLRVADQPARHTDVAGLLEAIHRYGGGHTRGGGHARSLYGQLFDARHGSVLMAMLETDDPLGRLVRRELDIASLFDRSPTPVRSVRVNTGGQWNGHLGSTELHIVDTTTDAIEFLEQQWTDALDGRVRRTRIETGHDPVLLERWVLTADADSDGCWTVAGDLHRWSDGEVRLDLDPTSVQR